LNNDSRHDGHGHAMGISWAHHRKRKPAALVGALSWCFLERMTRFELATLTLAKVVVTVRTVRLVLRSAPQSEFYGIVIYMYFSDHNPPHFHAIYAEHEAIIGVDDGSIIRGGLPKTAARLVEQWRTLHETELHQNWLLAQTPAPLSSIEPLQ